MSCLLSLRGRDDDPFYRAVVERAGRTTWRRRASRQHPVGSREVLDHQHADPLRANDQ